MTCILNIFRLSFFFNITELLEILYLNFFFFVLEKIYVVLPYRFKSLNLLALHKLHFYFNFLCRIKFDKNSNT